MDVLRHPSEPISQRRQFLTGLSYLMMTKGTPLPSTLTGILIPTYDPHKSPWRFLTISTRDTGIIRLASQDVDLYKLWISVFQAGGHRKVCKIDGTVRNIALTGSSNDSCQERMRGVRYFLPSAFRPITRLPYQFIIKNCLGCSRMSIRRVCSKQRSQIEQTMQHKTSFLRIWRHLVHSPLTSRYYPRTRLGFQTRYC